MNANSIKISVASVRVMRSCDYCHFEVCLTSNDDASIESADNLRKEAARLVDKAVAQFKIAKRNAEQREDDERSRGYLKREADRIRNKPETDRTPEEQAELKAFDDAAYRVRRAFDYEDDFETDEDY